MNAWLAYEREAKRHVKADLPSFSSNTLSSNASFPSVLKRLSSYFGELLKKIRLLLQFGVAGRVFYQLSVEERIPLLQKAYYLRKLSNLEDRTDKA